MPTYVYACAKCGREFEKFQPIADKPLTVCPRDFCQKKKWGRGRVKRVISAGGGLIFKGSGFYSTDYRSDSYKAAAKKDATESKPAPAKTESKPESKPAPAAKTKTN